VPVDQPWLADPERRCGGRGQRRRAPRECDAAAPRCARRGAAAVTLDEDDRSRYRGGDEDGDEREPHDAQPVKRGRAFSAVRDLRVRKPVDAINRAIRSCEAGLSNALVTGDSPFRWRIHAA
jgi:hypothetical protein